MKTPPARGSLCGREPYRLSLSLGNKPTGKTSCTNERVSSSQDLPTRVRLAFKVVPTAQPPPSCSSADAHGKKVEVVA
jgi:hypothetical protein